MGKKYVISFVFLFFTGFLCQAQGFDDLKKAQPVVFNKKLQALVNNNDVKGLEKLLTSKPLTINDGSNFGKNDRGATLTIPLFYDVVDKTLSGTVSIEACRVCLAAGCDVYTVYNGKTPIYRVMDFFATTPSDKCGIGMEVLKLLVAQKGFDLNRRYRSLPPPFSYLLSENFKYLGNKYSKDYLSTDLIRFLIDNGAYLNSYDENGASLLSLAINTDNVYLQNYLVDNGVNINKAADTEGNNAVYAAIADNNVPLLQKIVQNYNVRLTTSMVWTYKVSPDMYEYLVGQCAYNAYTYEELVDFRMHFSNRKEMVQDKYENIARQEVSQADDYNTIVLCEQRFPDLTTITVPRKRIIADKELAICRTIANIKTYEEHYPAWKQDCIKKKDSIYHADCNLLQQEYQHAQASINNQTLQQAKFNVNDFITNYSNYYDPEQKLSLAHALKRHYLAVDAASANYGPYYTATNSFDHWYQKDRDRIRTAIVYCTNNQEYQLYADWLVNMLNEKDKALSRHYELCLEDVKKVDQITRTPSPSRKYENDKDYTYTIENAEGVFSFTVTNYSREDVYEHYVVHGMKGGRLPGFLEGYGSMSEAVIAGYAAGTYGFKRTPHYHYRSLALSIVDKLQREIDLENARQSDVLMKALGF